MIREWNSISGCEYLRGWQHLWKFAMPFCDIYDSVFVIVSSFWRVFNVELINVEFNFRISKISDMCVRQWNIVVVHLVKLY